MGFEEGQRQRQWQQEPQNGQGQDQHREIAAPRAAAPLPTSGAPAPPPPFATTPTSASLEDYESVIRDLRERGMEDLASELLQTAVTAVDAADATTSTSTTRVTLRNPGVLGTANQEPRNHSGPLSSEEVDNMKDLAEHKLLSLSDGTSHSRAHNPVLGIGYQPEEDELVQAKMKEHSKMMAYYSSTNSSKNNKSTSSSSREVNKTEETTSPEPPSVPRRDQQVQEELTEKQEASQAGMKLQTGTNVHQPEETTPTPQDKTAGTSVGSTGNATGLQHAVSSGMPPPTTLVRHDATEPGYSGASAPGAYSVTPGISRDAAIASLRGFTCTIPTNHSPTSENDNGNGGDDDDISTTSHSTGSYNRNGNNAAESSLEYAERTTEDQRQPGFVHNSSMTLDTIPNSMEDDPEQQGQEQEQEQRLQQEQGHDQRPQHSLEAVRVDDIMTVKAEPFIEQSSQRMKLLMCLAAGVVCIVLILTLSLTLTGNESSADEAALAPTLSPAQRFEAIQQLLYEELAPLYDGNFNGTNGTNALIEVMEDPASPQYQAFEWLLADENELDRSINVSVSNPDDYTIDTGRILQRYALAVLYLSTTIAGINGTNWTDPFEFLTSGHECDWSGALQCSADDHIITLDLPKNGLFGTLPLELSLLTHLASLNLADNDLFGTLPPAMSTLTALKTINIGSNDLTGSVPVEYYRSWRSIEDWEMGENKISGTIASEIGFLFNLKEMSWIRNSLHGTVPPEMWSSLTNMEYFDLSQQEYRFKDDIISTEIGKWSNLHTFIYHGLDLAGTIPSELGMLTKLTRLQVTSNDLTGTIPSEIGMLSLVTWLSFSINGLTGTIPTTLLNLSNMDRFYADHTLLSGDVSFLCEAVANGTLLSMDPMRVDKEEVSGCDCCTCCDY